MRRFSSISGGGISFTITLTLTMMAAVANLATCVSYRASRSMTSTFYSAKRSSVMAFLRSAPSGSRQSICSPGPHEMMTRTTAATATATTTTTTMRTQTLMTMRSGTAPPPIWCSSRNRLWASSSSSSSSSSWSWSSSKSFSVFSTRRTSRSATTASATDAAETTPLKRTAGDDEDGAIENKWTTDRVRSTFVEFFQSKNHTYQPSSACVPLQDPTLLFTNAGMNQFKPIFLGQVDPSSPLSTLKRAANSQKCIRAGGKHNDLEDVGRDTYHHTFFEMLGSWSFGDYFQTEAIDYAWELLTGVYGLHPERLYATYFEGNDNVPPDEAARDLWLRYLPPERVIACSAKDNFWEMGDTGPCGPCTEIHYDRIGGRDASALVNADDPDVIEIWNVVFVLFNRDGGGSLSTLPKKHVDTGMGLERLVSILQKKNSNYDIDAFQPLFDKLSSQVGPNVGPYQGRVGSADAELHDTAYRAIADHARTLAFAIADGAVPNNEGRGYVLRRILRRAARYGQQILGASPGFFVDLMPVVIETFGDAFPELRTHADKICDVVREEEESFSSMLERGIKFFAELEADLKKNGEGGSTEVTGQKAFFLYDTLGFPIDLTELMASEAGLTVNLSDFQKEMQAQKDRSRQARNAAKLGSADADGGDGLPNQLLILEAEQTAWLADRGVEPTDDSFKYRLDAQLPATVMAIYGPDGSFLSDEDKVAAGAYVGVLLDKTPFYAEAGGQDADKGVILFLDKGEQEQQENSAPNDDEEVDEPPPPGRLVVIDVQSYGGFVLHTGIVDGGSLAVGSLVESRVDYDRRRKVTPNHSMTHVLNAALRTVLGDAVDQRGSLCNDEKLRFDFSHRKALTLGELQRVEDICQQVVKDGQVVSDRTIPLDEAKDIPGVRAVFGEVYPDPVRVVSIGDDTSVEFCGGTHVSNTAEAEAFLIVEETAVAKGIRRISAVTRDRAKLGLQQGTQFVQQVTAAEELNPDAAELDTIAGSMRKMLDEAPLVSAPLKIELRQRLEGVQKRAIDAKKAAIAKRVERILKSLTKDVGDAVRDGQRFMVEEIDIRADTKASQRILNTVKKLAPDMAFLGVSEEYPDSGNKVLAFATVPDAMIDTFGMKAPDWVNAALKVCEGRGGGKPGNAQGQAKFCPDVQMVLQEAVNFAMAKTEGDGERE